MASESSRVGRLIAIATVVVCLVLGSRAQAQDRFADYPLKIYLDPLMPEYQLQNVFVDGLKELWMKALERPDAELRRLLVDTIAIAHRRGVEGMDEIRPRLIALLEQEDQPIEVARAVVSTLIALDARDQADLLGRVATKYGPSIAEIAEPAIARWKSPVMMDAWLERIRSGRASQTMILLATDGLGALQTEGAAELLKLVQDQRQSVAIRVSAARALGRLQTDGLEAVCQTLLSGGADLIPSMLVVELLANHTGDQSVAILEELAANQVSAIQARAIQRLFEIDPELIDARVDELIESDDTNVRLWCARSMITLRKRQRIELLSTMLADINPSLRREVANGLVECAADSELRQDIIQQSVIVLNQNKWQGCEQATVVLTKLDQKQIAPRLVELLGHERPEVKVASAWALGELKVESVLDDMLDHAQSVYEGFRAKQLNDAMPGVVPQMAHLFHTFGDQEYKAAEPLIRVYLPKNLRIGEDARAAAVWAIGRLRMGNPEPELVDQLLERFKDIEDDITEFGNVRRMCAIAFGRMKAEAALPTLRRFARPSGIVGRESFWAIQQITGEEPPELLPIIERVDSWFLSPAK